MLIVIWGPDHFRSFKLLKKLTENNNVSLLIFDFSNSETQFINFLNQFRTPSLFKQKQQVVVKDFFSQASETEIKNLFDFLEPIISAVQDLIFFETEEPQKSVFNRLAKKADKAYYFNTLDKKEGRKFIKEVEKELNLSLSPDLREMILGAGLLDSGLIYHSLEKLALLGKNDFTKEEIKELFNWPKNELFFQLIDAALAGQRAQALRLLQSELIRGEAPLKIFNLLVSRLRQLISYKENPLGLSESLKGSRFYLYKIKEVSRRYPLEKLKKIYAQFALYDYKIKTGQLEPALALELILSCFFI